MPCHIIIEVDSFVNLQTIFKSANYEIPGPKASNIFGKNDQNLILLDIKRTFFLFKKMFFNIFHW